MLRLFRKNKKADETVAEKEGVAIPELAVPAYLLPPQYPSSVAEYNSVSSDSASGWGGIDRYDVMCRSLYQKAQEKHWLETIQDSTLPVVALRIKRLDTAIEYRCFPPLPQDRDYSQSFVGCVAHLNAEVAMMLSFPVVNILIDAQPEDAYDIQIAPDQRIQIVETMRDLLRARRYHYAAFVRRDNCLVIWADDVATVLNLGANLEQLMINAMWETDLVSLTRRKKLGNSVVPPTEPAVSEESTNIEDVNVDLEKNPIAPQRPIQLLQCISVMVAFLMIFTFSGLMLKAAAMEIKAIGGYYRIAVVVYIPVVACLAAFFVIVVSQIIFRIFGPVSQLHTNSISYSAIRSPRIPPNVPLPHVTIQCPVYKESIAGVINPTMQSLSKAITTYELQGGTANIFVNDDGMQIIPPEKAAERRKYYADHFIGWVARPADGVDGFKRKGRFKKASNMNYCLSVANRIEEILEAMHNESEKVWTDVEEAEAYSRAVEQIKQEDPTCWIDGDVRVGDLILIVDSDTRVPEDCLLDAASEFYGSPDLAILQHAAGVMMVVNNYWENLIAWFTRLVYTSIQYATASGDAAAFVGHNAFLRWSAIQEVSYIDPDDGRMKYWSESHVSEDFEISLKLRCLGFTIRYATYHNGEFQEGVSLTVYDEITRWQKYAYGCSELVFKPMRYWYNGMIFTPLFRKFLVTREIPFFCKFTIIAYIGTYYAIAGMLITFLANYFVTGWILDEVDHIYETSFQNFISAVVVFTVSPAAMALVQYRIKADTFWHALWDSLKWTVLLAIFFGGLSWHVSLALLSHMLSINMQWGATAKELEASNFFKELPKIIKGFKYMYIMLIILIIGMIMMAYVVPWEWQIGGFYSALPLGWAVVAHFLLPIALNPQLMTFTF
ncbi:glycosyl transferase family group 2-domain-containing protein [Limtongia smithiae]|uniref:glycosyl transferase family group 2-domain-containing protein n=1 Tax=Limtongia smithiae TaxID=1125753 RepID=UPI0034CD04E8